MNKNIVDELIKHRRAKGAEGLLPQNLTDDMLERMIFEIISLEDARINVPAAALLMAITMLEESEEDNVYENFQISFETEEIMEKFNMYTMALGIEDMRRKKLIFIEHDKLPTIENIFDLNSGLLDFSISFG